MMVPSGLKLLQEMSKFKVYNDLISNIVSNDFEIRLMKNDIQWMLKREEKSVI